MSLRSQPEFEAMETETAVQTATKEETMTTHTVENAASASVAATTAIATAAATSVGAPIKYSKAFATKENAIPVEDVEMWHPAAPYITGEQGAAKHSKKGKIGTTLTFLVESFNLRFLVVPGSNDKEAREKCRNSFDKKTISGDTTLVADYIEALKAEGYPKAHLETYVDLWGYVLKSDKEGVEDPDELVRVQLSKTSSQNFGYFCGQRGRAESSGKVPKLETVQITAESQEGSSGSYTNFSFAAPKA